MFIRVQMVQAFACIFYADARAVVVSVIFKNTVLAKERDAICRGFQADNNG